MPDKATFAYHAARDLIQRSRSGTLYYVVIFLIITLLTSYYVDHPALMSAMGVVIFFGTVLRAICVFRFDEIYRRSAPLWKNLFTAGVLSQALGWSIISMMSLHYYGWQWVTMVTLVSAAAFSAAAITSFSIYYSLVLAYLLVMFVPVLVMTVIYNTQQSFIATFLFGAFFLFLIRNAKRLSNEYWEALKNTFLLRDRAQELEVKNAELESFAYSVSHDLRAPLRSLDGFSKVLLQDTADKLNDTEKDFLQRICNAAQRMGQLIDDLLQLSRINRVDFKPQAVNLSELVKTNIERLRQTEPKRDVEVEIEPDVQATGDPALLSIALENLVSNAWKYTSKNQSSKIRFATTKVDGEQAYYIKDNGVGFDIQYAHKLFGPFQRLHGQEEFPGTGIGLATVKRVVDRHGGHVWVNSKLNKGSTFYFTLEERETRHAES